MHLEAARAQHRVVDHVFAIRHANHEDVVERVDTINLGEELVDDGIVHARRIRHRASALADSIDLRARETNTASTPRTVASAHRPPPHLIEDDDVEHRFVARVRLLLLRVRKERADLLFGTADVLVEDLRAVHNLGLARVEHLANLSRDERLAAARRTIQQHAADVRNAELRDDVRRKETRREGATEDALELTGQSSDACSRARACVSHAR